MVDVIVYKPSPYGLVFIHDKPLGFIIYHIKHGRVYVSYNMAWSLSLSICLKCLYQLQLYLSIGIYYLMIRYRSWIVNASNITKGKQQNPENTDDMAERQPSVVTHYLDVPTCPFTRNF